MTPEHLAACIAAVDAKLTKPCPHCGHASRSVVEELSNMPLSRVHVTGLLTRYVPAIPVVLVVCKGCGFVAAFSAHVLGVLDPDKPTPVEAPPTMRKRPRRALKRRRRAT